MKYYFLFFASILSCRMAQERPKKMLYENLTLQERAKFDFYYLNKGDSIFTCNGDERQPYLMLEIDVKRGFDDSLGFHVWFPSIGCSSQQLMNNNCSLENGIEYYPNRNIKQVFRGQLRWDDSESFFPPGYEFSFLDTLKKRTPFITPWLKRFIID